MSLPADESPPSLSPCYLDLDSVKSSPESIASLPEVATYPTDEPSSSRAGLTSTSESSLKSSTPKDRRPPQTCDVCGEKANSFHYDVASCNGCRTFFRRAIALHKTYACFNDGKCPPQMYRNCRACRFDRCIACGMNLDAMKFSAAVDVQQAAQAIAHRRKELLTGQSIVPFKYHVPYQPTVECRELDSLVYVESRCHNLRQIVDPWEQAMSTLRTNILEKCRLDEVKMPSMSSANAHAFEFAGRNFDYKDLGLKRSWISVDFFLFVEAAKTLPVFERLPLNDKEVLLVHVSMAATTLTRVFYSLAMQSTTLIYPDGAGPIVPFFKTGLEEEIVSRVMEPMIRVGLAVDEFVLLKAIVYCSPDADDLSRKGREALEAARQRYAGLLLRHLQRKLGTTAGARRFAEILALVDTYFHFGLKHRQHCMLIGVAFRMPTPHRLRMIEDIFRGYVPRPNSAC